MLFFGVGDQLWRSDGTEAGTMPIQVVGPPDDSATDSRALEGTSSSPPTSTAPAPTVGPAAVDVDL
jgi:ELWxxDGT repeat protein